MPRTKESGNRIDYWREKAFEALDTLRQANDNCERLEAERDALREALNEIDGHVRDGTLDDIRRTARAALERTP